jgi:hypothetical protein
VNCGTEISVMGHFVGWLVVWLVVVVIVVFQKTAFMIIVTFFNDCYITYPDVLLHELH